MAVGDAVGAKVVDSENTVKVKEQNEVAKDEEVEEAVAVPQKKTSASASAGAVVTLAEPASSSSSSTSSSTCSSKLLPSSSSDPVAAAVASALSTAQQIQTVSSALSTETESQMTLEEEGQYSLPAAVPQLEHVDLAIKLLTMFKED